MGIALGVISMELGIQLFIMAIFGLICAAIANSRGRSPVGWFFIGFFFGCLGLIVLFVIQDLKAEAMKEERRNRQFSRIEQRQTRDRASIDRRLETHNRRISAHDQAMGVDTIEAGSPDAAAARPPSRRLAEAPPTDLEWYYAVDADAEEETGPVEFGAVLAAFQNGKINANSLVWHEQM
ncbi:MAG: DUF4339 domain-containing protein, partial [Planctomycetes bacterium]|nr:DUF4339 domain-containing protein [Planctomycetota bacterium]